jgi:hypothetical protein
LRRLETNLRSGNFLVSGDVVDRRSMDFSGRNPAVITWVPSACPLDVAVLPQSWVSGTNAAMEAARETYTDERTFEPIVQRVEPARAADGLGLSVSLETAYGKERVQMWKPGLPSWSTWEVRDAPDREYRTVSRLIDWSNRPEH